MKPRHSPLSSAIIAPVMLLLFLCGACGGPVDLERSRSFQEAQDRFNTADSPEAFLEAAALFQRILDVSFINGAVLYNLGNAYMNADQRGLAVAAFRQARRYRPRDPFLENNLRFALGSEGPIASSRTLLQHILFWQDWLSYPEKFLLLAGFGGLSLFLGLASLLSGGKRAWKRLLWAALLLTFVLAVSAAFDGYRFEWILHGVVINDDVMARKGNSESYPPSFTEALKKGTEFRVLDKRGEWLLIRLMNRLEGWILDKEAALY